jgi:hypothetical protein
MWGQLLRIDVQNNSKEKGSKCVWQRSEPDGIQNSKKFITKSILTFLIFFYIILFFIIILIKKLLQNIFFFFFYINKICYNFDLLPLDLLRLFCQTDIVTFCLFTLS